MKGSAVIRKVLHVGFGLGALLLRWLTPWQTAALMAAALVFNLVLLNRLSGGRLLKPTERRGGFSWGFALYPAVLLVVIVVFHNRLELVAAIWAVVAFGDGMAGLCGLLLGGPRLPWNRDKTWAGFVAFVLYGAATSAFVLRWTQQAVLDAVRFDGPQRIDWIGLSFLGGQFEVQYLLGGCLAASLVAAVAESLDVAIDDNLTVPLAGGIVLWAATLL